MRLERIQALPRLDHREAIGALFASYGLGGFGVEGLHVLDASVLLMYRLVGCLGMTPTLIRRAG
jgi:hypothetical protein